MAIDFNKLGCSKNTNIDVFGICDDPPPDRNPAYLDFAESENWIAWVDNQQCKDVLFTAIDNCIEIDRANGERESRCDGMLQYDVTLLFLELKDRDSSGWLGKARDQLKKTIEIFKNENGLNGFNKYYACVANKQRPRSVAAYSSLAEQFEDETGFIFKVDQIIKIH